MDDFSRYATRVAVAQICQTIGWSKIQSTPLEVLTDFMQEYIVGLGRIANNYAMLMGQSEPNLTHVSLAFKDMDISFRELKEYITDFESGSVLDVPKYPIPKESHLNHLKPGSREVLMRPVHVHEHLPPMFPQVETEEFSVNKSPSYDRISDISPVIIKTEPGYSKNIDNMIDDEDDVRPLRELSSVLMTTSGFLSCAREGKLPEVCSLPPEPLVTAEITNKKVKENQKKKDKENRLKKTHSREKSRLDKKSKHKKHKKSRDKTDSVPSKSRDLIFSNKPQSKPKISVQTDVKLENEPLPPASFSNAASPVKLDNIEVNMDIDEDSGLLKEVKSEDSFAINDFTNQESPTDIKGNAMIDLSSTSYFPKTNHGKINDEDPGTYIDVMNSSPIGDYDGNSSPPIELYSSDLRPEVNGHCSSFEFHRKSPLVKNEPGDFGFDFERQSPETGYGGAVQELNTYSPRIKEESLSPPVELGNFSPQVRNESLSPPIELDHERPGNRVESRSPEINFLSERPMQNLQRDDGFLTETRKEHYSNSTLENQFENEFHFPEVNEAISIQASHPKKKKKKDKKNKDKEKNKISFDDKTDSEIKIKSKKKKKDHKKEKMVQEKIEPVLDLYSESQKRTKLENAWSHPSELNLKNEIVNNIQQNTLVNPPISLNEQEENSTSFSHENTLTIPKLPKKVKDPEKKKEKRLHEKKKEKRKETPSLEHLSEDLFSFEPLKKVKHHEKPKSASPLPKITFKLGPSPPKKNSASKPHKIVIKTVTKQDEFDESPNTSGMQLFTGHNIPVAAPSHQNASYSHPAEPVNQETPYVTDPNQIWICPACNRPDDGSPMIACDLCDLWFHWVCVGIREAIEGDWFCKMCLAKKEHDKIRERKKSKKHKKKKS